MTSSHFDPDYEPDYFELALYEQQGRLFKECQFDFECFQQQTDKVN